jgi:hypothetical protein
MKNIIGSDHKNQERLIWITCISSHKPKIKIDLTHGGYKVMNIEKWELKRAIMKDPSFKIRFIIYIMHYIVFISTKT